MISAFPISTVNFSPVEVLVGDCRALLPELPDESLQCCVTSPPYWGLRDYGESGQVGLEKTPEEYVAKMVEIFREVRRVLRKDGTLWLNLGDSYAHSMRQSGADHAGEKQNTNNGSIRSGFTPLSIGLKEKDLCGIPWRVAFALQADGWWLRSDIIWSKPNPMPESVTDRPTKAHEYLFLLTKSANYYYDQAAIKEPCRDSSIVRLGQDIENQLGSDRVPGKTNGRMKAVTFGGNNRCPDTRLQSGKEWKPKTCGQNSRIFQDRDPNHSSERKHRDPAMGGGGSGFIGHSGNTKADGTTYILANKKTVWTVATQPFKEAHFATYPPDLIKPCIMAGTKPGDTVLDPFAGSGTTGMVALELGRNAILIELSPKYAELIEQRTSTTMGLALA
jgi:DNA modification methylase